MIGSSKSVWGFDPRSVPGCQLWLDGADASTVTGTTTVTQWRDKSGNARHLGVGSGTTSYSSNAIQLASSYMFVTSPVDLSKVTVFIVVKTSGGDNRTVFSGRPNTAADYDSLDGFGFYMDNQTAIRFHGQSANLSTFSVNTSTPQLFSFQSSGTSISGWLNGTSQSGGTLSSSRTSTAQGFAIGAAWGGSSYGNIVANASIYEILVYNSALTTSERQQVEGYLAHKWELSLSIPSTHPFYSIRPHLRTFQPIDVPGCQLWLDAADASTVVQSSGSISQWNDKSANALTATAVNNPTLVANVQNGLPGISLNGSNQYFNLGNNLNMGANQLYIFVVSKFNSTADGAIIGKSLYGGGVGRYSLLRLDSVLIPLAQGSGNGNDSGVNFDTNTSVRLLSMIWDRNTIVLYQNGTSVFSVDLSDSSNATNNNSLLIGAYQNGSGGVPPQGFYMNGYIYEILLYLTPTSSPITTTQRQQIEGYIAHKWGLSLSIPSTHPFKSFPPASLPFSPRNISGVALWLDAADQSSMTLSGSSVTQWNDKSGRGFNAATPAGTNPPVYNSTTKELQFVAANTNVLRIAQGFGDALVGTTYSIFFLGRRTVASGYHFFLGSTADGGGRVLLMTGFFDNTMHTNVYDSAFSSSITTYTSPDPVRLYCYEVQSSSLATHILNGTQIGSGTQNYTLTSFANPELGRRYGATLHTFNLSEMIAFSPALTTSQRQQVEGYLAHKWGLSASLPATHPYKKFPT
jgi:hypothetical protein